MNDIIKRIKTKIINVQNKTNRMIQSNGVVPKGKNFIGTVEDFRVYRDDLDSMTDQQILEKYSEKTLAHFEATLDSYLSNQPREINFEFSKEVLIQICRLLAGKKSNNEELLQTLYMTIFQRYNDDIKTDRNYIVTEEFAQKVYRFSDEPKHKDVKYLKSSEDNMGQIYVNEAQYLRMSGSWNGNREEHRMFMVKYMLRKIRGNMMHGHFNNKYDREGNKIVQIESYDFKAKFFFDCIEEFYEAIVKDIQSKSEIQNKTQNERLNDEVLFQFQKDIISGNELNSNVLKDQDKLMRLIVPLFINSFVTYNVEDKGDFNKIRDELRRTGKVDDLNILNLFDSDNSQDGFIQKIENYNGLTNRDRVFAHLRNSVVHNNFECKDNEIRFRDFDKNGNQTADFKVPYSYFLIFLKDYIQILGIQEKVSLSTVQGYTGEEQSNNEEGR